LKPQFGQQGVVVIIVVGGRTAVMTIVPDGSFRMNA
jgi:hypothetical protein